MAGWTRWPWPTVSYPCVRMPLAGDCSCGDSCAGLDHGSRAWISAFRNCVRAFGRDMVAVGAHPKRHVHSARGASTVNNSRGIAAMAASRWSGSRLMPRRAAPIIFLGLALLWLDRFMNLRGSILRSPSGTVTRVPLPTTWNGCCLARWRVLVRRKTCVASFGSGLTSRAHAPRCRAHAWRSLSRPGAVSGTCKLRKCQSDEARIGREVDLGRPSEPRQDLGARNVFGKGPLGPGRYTLPDFQSRREGPAGRGA
jgi:hypothetical protein